MNAAARLTETCFTLARHVPLLLVLVLGSSFAVAEDDFEPHAGMRVASSSLDHTDDADQTTRSSDIDTSDFESRPTSPRSVGRFVRQGGPMLMAIAFCSIVLFIFVFERAICLRRGRVIPGPFVKRFIDQLRESELNQQDALRICKENRSPVADVFAAAVKKWDRPAVEVEQAVLDTGERVANLLRKYLRLFHGISTISPLLGLLGTVLGMIQSFNAIAHSDAMGRPELLASGISQALLTTAGGLTVAIPAIAAHLYFIGRVDRLVMEIDALGQDVVNAIASDGWRENTKSSSDKKKTKVQRAKAA